MIKVKNLNKFYNKNKNNEIHVINNISLDFADTGLVCLLGPSGSGKTTLLNAIGGLDKVNSGTISYDNDVIEKYKSNEWDYIRNSHVGYIFQNYNLLLNLTVYENVMFTLKMTNLDEETSNQRVMYALELVGLEKYSKRKVTQLSGGQQQRVAIARALAKSPNIIIADEPTGNLDEKNTTAIMNIIKKISEKCLVILVTHEQRIANFYADRIITLKDGQIIDDKENKSSKNYEYSDDNNIYLKELNNEVTSLENCNINYFFEKKEKLDFKMVLKDNVLYIESSNDIKIKVLDNDDEMKIIDSKKPDLNLEEVDTLSYDLDKIDSSFFKKKSNVKIKDSFKMAFKRILEMRRIQKLVFLGFMVSGFLFVIGVGSLFNSINVDDSKFIRSNYDDYNITLNYKNQEDNLLEIFDLIEDNDLGILHQQDTIKIDYKGFIQGNNSYIYFNTYNSSYDLKTKLSNKDVLIGEYGTENDVLIDKIVLENSLKEYSFKNLGFLKIEDFIGLSLNNNSMKISGIVDTGMPVIYMSTQNLIPLNSSIDINVAEDLNLELKSNQVLINKTSNLNIDDKIIFNEIEYIVSGYTEDYDAIITRSNYIKEYHDTYVDNFKNAFILLSFDNQKTELLLKENSELFFITYNTYESDREWYMDERKVITSILFMMSGVLTITSLVFLYFIMRSSLISRIYDIGVYRALGITKIDIYKIFSSEIFLISLFSSFIGYLVAQLLLKYVGDILDLSIPFWLSISSLILIFTLNIFIGLTPIRNLLKLTPSEIGSKYDI